MYAHHSGIIAGSRHFKIRPRLRSLRYGLRPGEIGLASVHDLTLCPCSLSSHPWPRGIKVWGLSEKVAISGMAPWGRHSGQLPSSFAQTDDLT